MRKNICILLLPMSLLFLFITCKNPEISYNTFSILEDNIQPGTNAVSISGEYDFMGEVMGIDLNVGLDEQLVDAESYPMNMNGPSFSITVENLSSATTYYCCFVVKFDNKHVLLTDISNFTTLSDKPKVRTLEVMAVDITSYLVKSIVDDDCGSDIIERGVCWGVANNPTLDNNHVAYPVNGLGEYTCSITGLEMGTTYFVRAYAINETGLSYAEEILHFKTEALEKPIVETKLVGFTPSSAVCEGKILNEGSSPVIERGIRWGTSPHPDNDGEFVFSISNENSFEIVITPLQPSIL